MAENQGFLKGIAEHLFKMCEFYAKWDAEALKQNKKSNAVLNC